jgi:hypothetical protein
VRQTCISLLDLAIEKLYEVTLFNFLIHTSSNTLSCEYCRLPLSRSLAI